MIFKKPLLSIIVILLVFVILNMLIDTNIPYVNHLKLKTGKLGRDSQVRILQISDLHDRQFGRNESYLLKLVKKADPDIIVITGDYADVSTTDFANLSGFADQLVKTASAVYFVPGNHEQENRGAGILYGNLRDAGVRLLMNANTVYSSGNISINICGVDFPTASDSYEGNSLVEISRSLEKATTGIDTSDYTVLLSHSPKIADIAEGKPIDLILSGHTHGGQVRIPLVGNLTAFEQDYFGKYDKGLFKLDGGIKLYVNSGLGTSIIPVRFCDRAEMTLITLMGE